MNDTVRQLGNPDYYVTALVGRWRAATAALTWINCGHPPAYLIDIDGELQELQGQTYPPLGTGPVDPATNQLNVNSATANG